MSNSYFRFRQFTIQQDHCAMKVCTDSCVLGAWTVSRLEEAKLGAENKVLDIGTGTGLLPLMLAQKSEAYFDAIESDPDAATQAKENIEESPWNNRIRLLEADARYYPFQPVYDFIISNPPFFESDLCSPENKKNKAKHDESLTLDELIRVIRSCLRSDGAFSILLPFHRTEYFENLAASNGFFLQEKLVLKQTPKHPPFRSICLFSYLKTVDPVVKELLIKNESGKYSGEFAELMRDYYS